MIFVLRCGGSCTRRVQFCVTSQLSESIDRAYTGLIANGYPGPNAQCLDFWRVDLRTLTWGTSNFSPGASARDKCNTENARVGVPVLSEALAVLCGSQPHGAQRRENHAEACAKISPCTPHAYGLCQRLQAKQAFRSNIGVCI